MENPFSFSFEITLLALPSHKITLAPSLVFGQIVAEFEPLSIAELKLCEACRTGKITRIGTSRPECGTEANRIRAAVLRVFCLDLDPEAPVHDHGVQIRGAHIEGDLDLVGCEVRHPLTIVKSVITGDILLDNATTRALTFSDTRCRKISGDGLICKGSFLLNNGFIARGTIRLRGAIIANEFICSSGRFEGIPALTLQNTKISGSIHLDQEFIAKGTVRLHGVNIGNDFICQKGIFMSNPSISLQNTKISGTLYLNKKFKAKGTVRLHGAKIGNDLNCSEGKFEGQPALVIHNTEISGTMYLDQKFTAKGTVRLHGALIGNDFICSKGIFTGHPSLALQNTKIFGNIYLNNQFIASQAVRLIGITIENNFICNGGTFNGSESISFNKTKISGTIHFGSGFRALGIVDLGGLNVDCIVDSASAWTGTEWRLDGLVYRRFAEDSPVEAVTRIRWLDRQPSDHLHDDFRPHPWEQCAKALAEIGHERDAVALRIEKRVRMRRLPLHRAHNGRNEASSTATARQVTNQPRHNHLTALISWIWVRLGVVFDFLLCLTVGYGFRPKRALYGLTICWAISAIIYSYIVPKGVMAPTDALIYFSSKIPSDCRLDWVTFEPATRSNDLDRRALSMKDVGLTLDAKVGPPYPSEWNEICPRHMPSEYTTFSPWVYSLDVLLPIIDLRQEKDWSPRVTDEAGNTIAPLSAGSTWGWGYVTRLFEWVLILVGWSLSALLLGAVTGVIRRE